ncbi:histidine phosphatase family protein [Stutzerimonas stutzeri]|uniref:histidine phosphatase family protein n=1 Tax=Stutzerimonas stutzeri TaxID=316 RepID=UPI000C9C1DEC|nr:histidine phosphatase family protein [Stutzerimonas stutzeri]
MRIAVLVALLLWAGSAWSGDEMAWTALREGRAVLLMRHALAPGTGDPPGFVLEDCTTQRNLDQAGRLQAERWGDLLRQNSITAARVLSSRWCRALDTAELLGFKPVEPLPLLDSFFVQTYRKNEQTQALLMYLRELPGTSPIVLISHQVNITALTGIFPRSGEALVLALPISDPPQVLARLSPP